MQGGGREAEGGKTTFRGGRMCLGQGGQGEGKLVGCLYREMTEATRSIRPSLFLGDGVGLKRIGKFCLSLFLTLTHVSGLSPCRYFSYQCCRVVHAGTGGDPEPSLAPSSLSNGAGTRWELAVTTHMHQDNLRID